MLKKRWELFVIFIMGWYISRLQTENEILRFDCEMKMLKEQRYRESK